nr:hypothetical protein Iba_chr04dCG15450 [Ipomoea batatas]
MKNSTDETIAKLLDWKFSAANAQSAAANNRLSLSGNHRTESGEKHDDPSLSNTPLLYYSGSNRTSDFNMQQSLESPGINSTEELEPRSTIENAFVRSALQLFNQRSRKVRFVKLLNPCRLESLFADAERKPVFYLSPALGRRKGS